MCYHKAMNRAILSSVVVTLSFFADAALAQQPTEGWANRGGWKFEVRPNANDEKEIWIIPEATPGAAKLMTTTPGWGNLRVHVRPDDLVIIVEDGGGSLGIDLRIFQTDKTVAGFVENENVRIGDVLETWAVQKAGAPAGTILSHRYVHALGWSPSGSKLLVSIAGSEGAVQIPGWFAVYDLQSGDLGFDLSLMNE